MRTSSKFAWIESGLAMIGALLLYPKAKHYMEQNRFHTVPQDMRQFDHNFDLAQIYDYPTGIWGTAKFYIDHRNMYVGKGHLDETLYQIIGPRAKMISSLNFVGQVTTPQDSTHLFSGTEDAQDINRSLTTINGLEHVDTSSTKDMSEMFYRDQKLRELDLSHWDVSHVDDMFEMFYGDLKLRSLNLTGWQVNQVQDFMWAFRHVPAIDHLDLSSLASSHNQQMNNNYAHLID